MTSALGNPVIAALDLDSPQKALELAMALEPHVGGFKIGPRLTHRAHPDFVQDLSRLGLVFFDHKFFDIPSTMVAAVQAAAEAGASWVTVHALAGPVALRELASLESRLRAGNPLFRVAVVTVLTSFTPESLPPVWDPSLSIASSVSSLARGAFDQGLRSFVCSAEEAPSLRRELGAEAFLIVPGVRPSGSPAGDQSRVATPAQALGAGADALVIGRPLIEAVDPVRAAIDIGGQLGKGRA